MSTSFQQLFEEIAERYPKPDEPESEYIAPPRCKRCGEDDPLQDDLCLNCQKSLRRGYDIRRMTGRCANGAERDGGALYHAVPIDAFGAYHSNAVCGAKPGKRSVGWSGYPGQTVTCKRCIRRLANQRFHSDRATPEGKQAQLFNINSGKDTPEQNTPGR
jgi:hypothetical protein